MKSFRFMLVAVAVLGVFGAALTGTATMAAATSRVVVTGHADINVWIDDSRDVYADYSDVVISLRALRDCYATVFVIDTDGYVHVVRPLSPWDRAWIRGGHTYRYTGRELGLAVLGGRGIAHVFAVSSPYPFDYSPYGEAIFAGRFGFRVYGDPFIACREIYLSLLPPSCGPDYVSVSFARFYIREWTRYPGYLCRGHGGLHVRVGDYCRQCSHLYDSYRVHVADPYVVIHPRAKFRKRMSTYAEVKRSTVKYKSTQRREAVAGWSRASARTNERAVNRVVSRKPTGSASATPRRVTSVKSRRVAPLTRPHTDTRARHVAPATRHEQNGKAQVTKKRTSSKRSPRSTKATKGVTRSKKAR